MNQFVSKFGVGGALFAAFAIMSTISSAKAEEFLGTWNITNCPGAHSSFIQLQPGQTEFGFGATDVAARLINFGGAATTAGAYLTLPNDGPFTSFDFRQMTFLFMEVGNAASHTTVRFCFRGDHGTGSVSTVSMKLSTMAGDTNAAGWTLAQVNSQGFGRFFASNAVLEKVSFELQSKGDLEIGDTVVHEAGKNLRPVQVNYDKQSCSNLNSCN